MNTGSSSQNKWLIHSQRLAAVLVLAGILLNVGLLSFMQIKPEIVVHTSMVIEGLFVFLVGGILIFIFCCRHTWMQGLENRFLVLFILGVGMLFLYAATDFASNFVLTASGDFVHVSVEIARLAAISLLVISAGLWIRDLMRTRQMLLRNEKRLEDSEQRFRDVAEAAGEYIWEIDPGGTYSFLTPRVEDVLGRRVDEVLGRSPFDFMPHEEARRVEKMLAGWAEKGESWQGLEHQSVRPDGRIIWQRVSGMPVKDSEGELKGFRGTGLDITAEKEARQATQELTERLRLATEAAELGIWDLRISDGYLEWDEGMFRIYGVSRDDFTNSVKDWTDALLPEYREQAEQDFKAGIAGQGAYRSEFKIRRKDGEIRHIRAMAQSIHDETGNPVRVVGINEDITEQKMAEQELRQERDYSSRIIQMSPAIICGISSDGTCNYVNPAGEKVTGYSAQELVGKDWWSTLYPGSSYEQVRQLFQDMQNGPVQNHEMTLTRKDGHERIVEWNSLNRLDQEENLLEVVGFGHDITDRRIAEEELFKRQDELEKTTRELEGFFDVTLGLLMIADFQGRILKLNRAWEDILGYPLNEIARSNLLDFVHPRDQEKTREAMSSLSRGEHVRDVVNRYQHKNGGYIWVRWQASSREGLIYASANDITESIMLQERLAQEKDFLQQIIDSSPNPIFAKDWHGRHTLANTRVAELFGTTKEAMLGKTDYDMTATQEEIQAFLQDDREVMQSGKQKHIPQEPLTDSQGQVRWFQTTKVPLMLSHDPKKRQVMGIATDITHRIESEHQVQLAREEAEAANRAKSDFLANMSHEIRTPMNAVIGLSQLLLQTSLDDRQRDYLNKISNSSRMLLGIINDILDYSKIEAGKLELDMHTFRMDELLDQMKTLFGSTAEDKGLEIIFNISTDVPRILKGDSLRLGQVFTNLLGNAVKFTEKGHVELAVHKSEVRSQESEVRDQGTEVRSQDLGQGTGDRGQGLEAADRDSESKIVRLLFEIKDTGIGMDDEQVQRLFQPFSQADTSTTRKYGGTGLGLVISHKLVQRMGGTLQVDSTPGQGSRFYFEIDLPMAPESETTQECIGFDSHRVLVVDDHEAARQVLRNILESCMFQVKEAHDGRSAVDAVVAADRAGEPYEFVFMDWKMPGELDGLQAAREIDRLYAEGFLKGNRPPFVVVSAYQRSELPEDSVECFNCFLSKPVTASSIFNAIAEATGKAPSYTRDDEQFTIPSFQGYSILLAEDNALNQEVAWQMLEKTGAALSLAANGAEAVEMVEAGSFDLVLMDLQMPVMDGFEATRKILERFPDLPVIALSAAVMEEDRNKSRQAGMRDHLSKPIESTSLYRTLARWLQAGDSVKVQKMEPEQDSSLLPRSLEGFDLAQGLRSADRDSGFYHRMLLRFREQLSGEFARIDEELDKGKSGDGPRLVHTLKGLAGTVGAVRLAEAASFIDLAFKENREITLELRRELDHAMHQARTELDGLEKAPGQSREVDQEEGVAAMSSMLQLLKNSEMVQDELIEAVTGFLRSRAGVEEVDELAGLVENFEHDAAVVKLLELASRSGVSVE
ncbi:multi-sensor hybrid histidine kinase [Desulfonatronospira thiodismutans ASO3-1]|uniref:histidine kinase n=1 Tax=Desulfonatronospira thiodismutans ASO3-1 TaxID=555779 RepID=D6SRG8_9BACT|nr:PAS domain S-box protein [Desulfonatronospira thiodismutans]EFI33284.1 multi-sensor hybrid histidine kinase [Desulfonatronospira thiodismutans ASO3-1]